MGRDPSRKPSILKTASLQAAAGLIASGLWISACTANKGPAPVINSTYVVVSENTPFYKYGPAQTFGPDMTLAMGRTVTLMTHEFGYSRVMLQDGVSGYVPNDDIKPLPPTPPPKPTPNPGGGGGFWSKRKSPPPGTFSGGSDPLFDVRDVPPPPMPAAEKNAPATPPPPPFRY